LGTTAQGRDEPSRHLRNSSKPDPGHIVATRSDVVVGVDASAYGVTDQAVDIVNPTLTVAQ
jgi:hypothetical protein